MEVSITHFRRNLFDLVNQAMDGGEIWVTHQGRRFRIAPDPSPGSRLSRITPLEIIHPDAPALQDRELQTEMTRAWEKDWETL